MTMPYPVRRLFKILIAVPVIYVSMVVVAYFGQSPEEERKDYSNLGETVRKNQAKAAELCPDSAWVKRDAENRRNFCCTFAPNVYPALCAQYGLRP